MLNRNQVYFIVGAVIVLIVVTWVLVAISQGDELADRGEGEEQDMLSQTPDIIPVHTGEEYSGEKIPMNDEQTAHSFAFEPLILEAEEATISQLTIKRDAKNFSGTGYVTGFTNDTGRVSFDVQSPGEALFQLTIGYRTPHGYKAANLLVNDEFIGEVALQASDVVAEAAAGTLLLKEGSNVIAIEKGWGWYDIDYIKIERAEQRSLHEVEKTLVNPNASKEAQALMSFLVDQYGKFIISGQQEYPNSQLVDVKYIVEHTGRTPAILGLDFIDNTPSRVERGTSADETKVAIDWWHERGGIVAFTWHWNAPKDLIDQPGKEWWRGFYTEATTFDVAYALDHPDSEDYKLLIRDIDAIAEHLLQLQEASVPVLWRPLHEAEGGWFWWGAKGPEPAIALWRLMYERMTHHHQLNNLIWVWNSVAEEWYPGDDVVDIVSYDSYPGAYNYTAVSGQFEKLVALGNNKKLIALAENGPIPDPDLIKQYQAHWSWFSTWNGEILREHNEIDHLKKVYNHPHVLTLEDLPDLMKDVR